MSEFAVIKIGSKQYKVKSGDTLKVERLPLKVGEKVSFDTLFYAKDESVQFGTPFLQGLKIKGEVLGEEKGLKLRVVKYKPKSHYKRERGHRQKFTLVKITSL